MANRRVTYRQLDEAARKSATLTNKRIALLTELRDVTEKEKKAEKRVKKIRDAYYAQPPKAKRRR